LAVAGDAKRCFVGEGEELDVFREAVGHRKLVNKLVLALDGLASWRNAGDRHLEPWLGYVVADPECLPPRIARPEPHCYQPHLFIRRSLVVSNGDTATPPAVLLVQAHHGMRGRARAGEEVENCRLSLVRDEEAQRILDSVQ